MNHPFEANDRNESTEGPVPDDFPHNPFPASLAGVQPKLSARLIEGHYVVGLTEDERRARYLMCSDMVEQLIEYTERKHHQRTDLTMAGLLDQVDISIRNKGWELGAVELDWIMKKLRSKFLVDQQPESCETP